MGRALRIQYENALYHVISRGNTRSRIFKNDADKVKFLEYLYKSHKKYKIVIHSYCLMDNHYHLLIQTPHANLSRAMKAINTGYTNYYNHNHNRTGHLFSGRYKGILVEKDNYVLEVSAYIHLNPVRAKIVERPEEYKWSSYCYYTETKKKKPDYINLDLVLENFGNKEKKAKRKYMEYTMRKLEIKQNLFEDLTAGTILGSDSFVKWIRDNAEQKGWINVKSNAKKKLFTTNELQSRILEILNTEESLLEKNKRKVCIYLLKNYTEMSLKEISEMFPGLTKAGVFKVSKRFEEQLLKNKQLDREIEIIKKELKV